MPYTRWSPNFTAFETYQSEIDTHIEEATLPPVCPWTPEQVLDAAFWPEGETTP